MVETDSGETVCSCCGLVIAERPETGHNHIELASGDGWSGYNMSFLGSTDPGNIGGISRQPIYDGQNSMRWAAFEDIAAVNQYCPVDSCPPRIRNDVLDMMRRLRISRRATHTWMPQRPVAVRALLYLAHENRNVPLKYDKLLAGLGHLRARSIRRLIRDLRREFFPQQSTFPSDLAHRDILIYGHGLPPAALKEAGDLVPAATGACPGSKSSIIAAACVLIALAGGSEEFRRKTGWRIGYKPDACTQEVLAKRFCVSLQRMCGAAKIIAGIGSQVSACAACGVEFRNINGTRKTCSPKCSLENRRRKQDAKAMRTCAACGAEFMVVHSREKNHSSKCAHENMLRRNRQCAKKTLAGRGHAHMG